jgi:DNA-binding transcriptional ArsR family regulator
MEARMAAVEARLDALEQPAAEPQEIGAVDVAPTGPDGRWWIVERLASDPGANEQRNGVAGHIAFGGRTVDAQAGETVWQVEQAAADVLDADLDAAASFLAALGHPVRLAIVREMLRGARTLEDLRAVEASGTTGRLQHHLRELRSAGVVTQIRRNDYALRREHIVPCLVLIAAASSPPA